jgi:SagB-type dehydrogenase family enzyme
MDEHAAEGVGLTIRLGGRRALVSLDDGTSVELPAATHAELLARLPPIDDLRTQADTTGMSAAAQSSLAEARAALPRGVRSPTENQSALVRSLLSDHPLHDGFIVPVTDVGPSRPFAQVLVIRRSVRRLSTVSQEMLGTVMARSILPRRSWPGTDGYEESSRPVPSAGACHSHALVLLASEVSGLKPGPWVLDADRACLRPSNHGEAEVARALAAVSEAMRVDEPPPAVVFAVARPSMTLARYPGGMPLLWRDAGALLATLHFAAADLGLGSCIVGTSGVLHSNDGEWSDPVDMGAVAIGSLR